MSGNFVSNKDEPVRLFKSDFLEFWTRVHPAVPVLMYLPAISYLLYRARTGGVPTLGRILSLFLVGIVAWTLTEYLIHRFVFHHEPRGKLAKKLFWLFHGIHHDYPNDSRRLVMPPAVSLPLALFFFAFYYLLLGPARVDPFFAGFLSGYLAYDMIHYAIHHLPWNRGMGLLLRQHHFRHHFQDGERGFGVSSPFWDHVFRTQHLPKGSGETAKDD